MATPKRRTGPYYSNDHGLFMERSGDDGAAQLTNFCCWIEAEQIYHDGKSQWTHMTIHGELNNGTEEPERLPAVEITAAEFNAMSWVADKWGMRAIIFPAPGAERHLRAAIQLLSEPVTQHIFTHTGWTTIAKKPVYLTTTGGIGPSGLMTDLAVSLPHELNRYALPKPAHDPVAFRASMSMPNIGPAKMTIPFLLATYRAAIGPANFAMHLSGRTGTFKSEFASLLQSHYGTKMIATALPGTWSSTANALERLAYCAAHALFTIDDYVPTGTSTQVRALTKTADQIFRAQGNQAGRSRLTDQTSLQQTYYPRGVILSTGEDIPEGHSMRGRMMIGELAPGDIQPKALTKAQTARDAGLYAQAMADWIHWLANKQPMANGFRESAEKRRDECQGTGHARTASIMGDLLATAELLHDYALDVNFLTPEEAKQMRATARQAVLEAGAAQQQFQEGSDPVIALVETIRNVLASQLAHLKTKNGGVPENAVDVGWLVTQQPGTVATYKSAGPRIGWIDHEAAELYLDPGAIVFLKKYAGGRLAISVTTLQKRLKESGLLTRVDETRQRNVVRVKLEGHTRNVLVLDLQEALQGDEKAS